MRLEISCRDRLGITQDILDILVEHKIDLRGIEINESGKIYLHFPNMDFEDFKHLMPKIRRIDGIEDVKTTSYMPGEREKQQLFAILQTLPDPVFSVDAKGTVLTCNQAAQASLEQSNETLAGQDILELVSGYAIDEWLDGKEASPETVKVKFIQQDYLADLLPVLVPDKAEGSILAGAVIMLKSEHRLGKQFNTFHHYDKSSFDHFASSSPAMKKTIKEAQQIADLDSPIVILGETGTGKEQLAKACHQTSRRAKEQFAVVRCSSLSADTIDNEIFGSEPGYSDSLPSKKGLLEQASEGTIFFDDVANLPENIQTKLIHVLANKTFSRLGSNEVIKTNARFICSSSIDLGMLVEEGKFSKQLFYKINVLAIGMPALRDRKADIIDIAEQCITETSAKLGKRSAKLSKSCVEFLLKYPWPGNVTQLHNALFRAISLLDGTEITKEDIQLPNCTTPAVSYIDESFDSTLDQEVKKFERDLLRRLYPSYPSTRQLAKKLGLSHTAIANKLREYGINKGTVKL